MKARAAGIFWPLWLMLAGAGCDSQTVLSTSHALRESVKNHTAVTTLDVEGVGEIRFFLDPNDQVITPSMWAGKTWEPVETRWFVDSLRAGNTVIDVGANIGYYTVIAGKIVGEEGRVYAFEPDPTSFELLERNVRLNGLDNVVLENKAVSNENGELELFIAPENKGDHRIYQPEGEARQPIAIEAVSLDSYFAERDTGVDFVKVDTQGAEVAIIQGMAGLIDKSNSIAMAFEYSPSHLAGLGATGRQLLDAIESHDLAIYELGMGGPYLVQKVTPANLERRFKPRTHWFTNLLLLKNRPDLVEEIEAAAKR